MAKERIDVVALQETIKQDFLFRDLLAFDPLQRSEWDWVPSVGHSGGLILRCSKDVCEVDGWEQRTFFIAASIKRHALGLTWVVVCVYGPADNARSAAFLDEITSLVGAKRAPNLPVIIGGILT